VDNKEAGLANPIINSPIEYQLVLFRIAAITLDATAIFNTRWALTVAVKSLVVRPLIAGTALGFVVQAAAATLGVVILATTEGAFAVPAIPVVRDVAQAHGNLVLVLGATVLLAETLEAQPTQQRRNTNKSDDAEATIQQAGELHHLRIPVHLGVELRASCFELGS
jgi:hypothetical protein